MQIQKDDVFSLKNGKYITLEDVIYEQQKYIFVNKLDEMDEPTNKFLVFKVTDKGLIEETNEENLRPLLEYFSNKANENLELVNELYKSKED